MSTARDIRPPHALRASLGSMAFAGSAVWALCLVALLQVSAGCGYKLVRPTGASGGTTLRVAVPALTNDSFDPTVAALLTDALRREILRRGSARLVDPASAEIVVVGRIQEVDTYVVSVSSVAAALEQQLEIEVDLRAERSDGSEVELSSHSYRDWELYLESADLEASRKNRDEALRRVAAVIATRFHDVLAVGLQP